MRRLSGGLAVLLGACLVLSRPTMAWAYDSQPVLDESTAACVLDAQGNALFEHNAYDEMPMASITKVMTAMVALDSGVDLDAPLTFVETGFPEGAQLAGYEDGDLTTLRELLLVTLIYSGNDAALNVAYAVAGSNDAFCELMNRKAQELGLEHTHFMNPHGLEEEGHYSCAHDLVVMGRHALEHYPFIAQAVHTPRIDIVVAGGTEVTLQTTDTLMGSYDGLLGIKTGKTESGTSFLGAARRNHVTLYSCALCCDSDEGRFDDTARMLDWGFGLYERRTLARASRVLRVAPWQDGFWLACPVVVQRDAVGEVFCEGALTYTTVMLKPSSSVAPGTTYGTTVWQQEGRHVESAAYEAAGFAPRTSAWNQFVAPLFCEDEGR